MSSYEPYHQPAPPAPAAKRTLVRSRDGKVLAGVCAGFADYTGLDVTLIRIVLVAATIFGIGTPILLYVVGWALMPERPEQPWPYAPTASLRDSSTESARP
ncbi:hypothetical protein DJ010_09755 [Nocardioides silvaticus]|uniref:Phage shock protein PspC N-terminal domain-containing protein n=1 Tax=Nocardioides silvaticus TaxID=2201891 RepID=A0A316THV6_9ACTN|nr:PspC domain-containing protein [Nocardioides silvaticus]PWN03378.1 hypothetical protein DJ010_09755 [Nocardioides silvaticus]